ncbi:MAG: ATP-binding protein [Desulfatirhabdiaceae bacterium]
MTDKETFSNHAINLRRQAEKKAAGITEKLETLSPEEIRQMVHELRVHQFELEMQKEELLATQLELDAIRARYFNLYDLAPVGYCTISEQGLILEANLTAATLLGVNKGALIRQPITRFINKEEQDIYYLNRKNLHEANLAGPEQNGATQTCELRMIKRDGALFWVRLEAISAIDSDGTPVYRVLIIDITDKKRIEMEEAALKAQKQRILKTESLGRMAGAIAHHFNNQLQVVTGNLDLAMMNLPTESDAVKDLAEAVKASHQAAEMSSLMLTYLGQSPCTHDSLDLSEACRQSLHLLQAAAPKDTFIESNFPVSGPVILANAGQIHHILTNLVTNAWESANNNRCDIRLSVKTVSPANILSLNRFPVDWQPRDTSYACLEVSDTGRGIAEKDFEKIFDPFFSTKFIGRGLGLPVVLGIVRAHQGAISVESDPDRGSIFRVYFPVSAEQVPQQADKTAKNIRTEGCGAILVVDDEDHVRDMVKAMLKHLGYTVVEARDGIEAVEMLWRHLDKICCVVCDLTMPKMDGWKTLAALRSIYPGIPVVLSSGYDEAEVMAGDHPERPDAFLGKPYHLKKLSDTIKRVLS